MSEAITVPNLAMMASTISEESCARDTHARTHAHTHTHTYKHSRILGVLYVRIFKVAYDFKNKNQIFT